MIRALSRSTGYLYKHVAKLLLFRFSPDSVHNGLLKLGKTTMRVPFANRILTLVFRYDNDRLQQNICGLQFDNPVGLSAGFDKNFELLELLPAVGFGFVEGGSLTAQASTGNTRPHYHRLKNSKSILVNAGLNNDGVEVIVARLQKRRAQNLIPLNISVAKTNAASCANDNAGIADYITSLRHIKKAAVGDLITLNISCPNAYGGEPFTTPKKLNALLQKVDELHISQPIFVKMPIDLPWPAFKQLLDVIVKHRIAGVTIGNLAKDRNNPYILDTITASQKGNMSGKPTWELSNNLIYQTYKHYHEKLVIIGVGGIFCAEDAYEKIKRGATLVELITGMIFEGPQLIGQINHGLIALLKADGYSTISEAIGSYHRK